MGHPKAKLQCEQIVASSGLPWTILRITQFCEYCQPNARKLSRFPSCWTKTPTGVGGHPDLRAGRHEEDTLAITERDRIR